MKKVLISLGFFGLAAVFIAWSLIGALPQKEVIQAPNTTGNEDPQDGALYENGWVVANHDNAAIMDAYLRYETFLGEPISGFDGRCQSFRLGRLCYRPGNPDDWKIEVANLGLEDLQVQGYTPKPGSTLHPALRDWLVAQLDAGVDITRVVGRVISEPNCDPRTNSCRQWTDKQLFEFDQRALTWDQVRRAPLGLWLTHTRTRPVELVSESGGSKPDLIPLLVGIASVVGGLAFLGSGGSRTPSLPV